MRYSSETWPMGAAMLQYGATLPDGSSVQDADRSVWDKVFAELVHEGFDHVDFTDTWLRPGDLSADRLAELKASLDDAGLRVTAISVVRRSVIAPDEEVAQQNFDYAMRTIKAVKYLGSEILSLGLHMPLSKEQKDAHWFWLADGHKDPENDPATWNLAVGRIRALSDAAAEEGIKVSLEMYEDTYVGTADSAVALVKDIDRENCGLNPDIGNIVRLHRPVEHWESMLQKMLPYTNYWHIKNYLRDYDPATGAYFSAPAPLASGYISYRRAMEIALEVGFDGPICLESYGGDGLAVCAQNREYLRGILKFKLGK
ncbi:sugar phosphate isomerase/epimerase family protein [Saxibacter everestensis]|uniref:Sugar phosphate isomerase/epimerase family protein n=1 Tax=Saxibacter everestensis TaxID=2909229 RepID=A0ABY8QSQ9_9MICO|nr:sugar phosphate isomerase/epimerase family protein [Brevibacteriaceae bacterium ZFBP1038]